MNQFVGLDHMRQAEKNLTEEELHSNDAQGFIREFLVMMLLK